MTAQAGCRRRMTVGGRVQNNQGRPSILLVGLLSAVVVYGAENPPNDASLMEISGVGESSLGGAEEVLGGLPRPADKSLPYLRERPPQFFRLPVGPNEPHRATLEPIPDWGEVQFQNAAFKVKIGKNAGGAITYISRPWSNESVISRRDTGRFVQQSFYGNPDGTFYAGRSWVWNPVQGGAVDGSTGILLQMTNISPSSISSVAIPRNWGGNQVMVDATMETTVTLKSDHILMSNRMYYTGWRNQSYRDQELPAVFLPRRFDRLWLYNGSRPWTGQAIQWLYPVTWEDVSKATATLLNPTEGWVAYQDSITGDAVGVMSPSAVAAIAYRVGFANVGGVNDFATSYLAPIGRFGIRAGDTVSYDVYITLGTVGYIRQVFTQIHNTLVGSAPKG